MNFKPLIHSSFIDTYNGGNRRYKDQCSSIQIFDIRDITCFKDLKYELLLVMLKWDVGICVTYGFRWEGLGLWFYLLHHMFWFPLKVTLVATTRSGCMWVITWRWWTCCLMRSRYLS